MGRVHSDDSRNGAEVHIPGISHRLLLPPVAAEPSLLLERNSHSPWL